MPRISKIRIVNLFYNNGHRMIPDELYDLGDAEGRQALDTLISLINGGGKTVLVQLMMQPVLPRAKAGDRRIEGYFTRPGDHCFVLLEWTKDGSPEKLLTGIAMAAAQDAAQEDNPESSRGRRVRYYTFCTNYSDYAGDCNIINMPLSRNENGNYFAAEYDFVRRLARKSGGIMKTYSSDEGVQWRRTLEEYGIYQDEWRTLMEPLNSEEGGMTEFFKKFRSSDQLIDTLLIPAIERRLNAGQQRRENSLATMLVSYIEQYRAGAKQIEEREICERYIRDIQTHKETVQTLWEINDRRDKAVRELFGFYAALGAECAGLEQSKSAAEQRIPELTAAMERIDHEEASEDYYRAKEDYEGAKRRLENAEQKRNELMRQYDETEHKLRVQRAARYYQKCRNAENEIKALEDKLSAKEQGETAVMLNTLGGSVRYLAGREFSLCGERGERLGDELEKCKERLTQSEQALNSAKEAESGAKSEYDRACGSSQDYQRETDKLLEGLGITLIRSFTGGYPETELREIFSEAERTVQSFREKISANEHRLGEIAARQAEIPGEQAGLMLRKAEMDNQLSGALTERENYLSLDEQMRQICGLYSLREESRFTGEVTAYLSGLARETESERRQTERRLQTQCEEIAAAENGSVHVPKSVLDHLERTGVRYQTCEHYFLTQIEAGLLTAERCAEILEACPAAAYGILLDDKEMTLLLRAERPEWLPAAVPLFTMGEMEKVLDCAGEFPGLLAYYSVRSFRDRRDYIAHLQDNRLRLEQALEQLEQRVERLREQMGTAKKFSYDEQWLPRQDRTISALEEKIYACDTAVKQLDAEKELLESERSELNEKLRELKESAALAEEKLRGIQAVLERLPLEENRRNELLTARERHRQCEEALRDAEKNLGDVRDNHDEICRQASQNEELRKELLGALEEVGNRGEVQCEGSWRDLLTQYRTLQKTQDNSIRELQTKINEMKEALSEYRQELERTKCEPEDYLDAVYDRAEEEHLEKEKNQLDAEIKSQYEICMDCKGESGKAESRLKSAEEDLRKFGGEPLEKNEIGGNYGTRRGKINAEQSGLNDTIKSADGKINKLRQQIYKINPYLEKLTVPETAASVTLEKDTGEQWKRLYRDYSNISDTLTQKHKELEKLLENMLADYPEGAERSAVQAMRDTLDLKSGDVYMSLDRQMDASLHVAGLRIGQINSDLADFDNTKNDMVNQCALQGQRIRQGLLDMEKSARVKLYPDRPRIELIRFGMPVETDVGAAYANIAAELEQSVRELSGKLDSGQLTDTELEKEADKVVSSGRLLRKYIMKEQIGLKAYKIDSDSSRSEYRTWESTAVDNSGAEKFLVYFAVILSLMHYTRSKDGVGMQEATGVLILDNPFGVITSHHVLVPMFEIARHFNVQLICLSDITKCDITACFPVHIKAKIEESKLSSVSRLTHDGNERIEHGYYRAVQMGLL